MKIKVGILSGGNSIEREVSFKSSENILKNIDRKKYDISVYEVNNDSSWINNLINNKPDIILSALHGGIGEDGSIQGLLKCLNIKYIGSGVLSSALCMDKYISKTIMKANHIPIADDLFISMKDNINSYQEKVNELGYPVIIKPNKGGSSIGINVAKNFEEVKKSFQEVVNINDDVLIEKYIKGQEITCCVIQLKEKLDVVSVLDISKSNMVFDYDSKYLNHNTKINFSSLPKFMQTMIQEIAKKVFNMLKCKSYCCVDMIVSEEQVYVIEINTLPGLTDYSLLPRCLEGLNINFGEFLEQMIEYELKNI